MAGVSLKAKKKTGVMEARIPLPARTKAEKDEDSDSEDEDPSLEKFLQNFKNLCGMKSSGGGWEDFIQVSAGKKATDFSCELESGLGSEDRYLQEVEGLVTHTKKPQEVEDYSGAAPAIIREKIGKKKLKKIKKEEREKTKGSGWFNMPAPELTEESRRDLELLQMRGALDPKRFYKKSDAKNLPKYFQIGTVVDSPYDFYSDRIPTKARKRTMVDELLADAEFKKYNKRKYVEIIEAKNSKEPRMRRTKKK